MQNSVFLQNFCTDKHKGFGFVEYELEDDCAAALDNMHGAELFGRVLRCVIAKPVMNVASGLAVWKAEDWIRNQMKDESDIFEDGEGAAPPSS